MNINRPWSPGWGAGGHWGDGYCNGYGGNFWHNGFPPYYGGWFNGAWNWNGPTWWGTAGAYNAGFLAGNLSDNFYNPYYVAPAVGSTVVYNYSEPVPAYVESQPVVIETAPTTVLSQDASAVAPSLPADPAPAAQPETPPKIDPKVEEAGKHFDNARKAFAKNDYELADVAVEQAIKIMPNDTALHEFRALCLFAMKNYRDSAGVLYSVLAVGPGWTWDTVKTLYDKTDTYAQQLKALRAYVDANPQDAASRFVLAYHSLVLDDRENAVKLLNQVVELNPKDQLAASMAKAISQSLAPAEDKPKIGG